jgi:PAS domain S-box-containing protein
VRDESSGLGVNIGVPRSELVKAVTASMPATVIVIIFAVSALLAAWNQMMEVTARKHQLQDLYDRAPCGYHSLSPDGVIVRVNKTELELLGYTEEEYLGRRFVEFLTRESVQTFKENFPRFLETGMVRSLEFDVVCKDGSIRSFLVDGDLIRATSGNPMMSNSTMVDNTHRKAHILQLSAMNNFLQEVVDALPFGVMVLDGKRQAILRNKLFGTLFELPLELTQKEPFYFSDLVRFNHARGDYAGQRFEDVMVGFNRMMDTRQTVRFERQQVNGSFLEICGQPIEHDMILLTYTDISTHKHKEQVLADAKKVAEAATVEVDSFAYAVSHDLRAPLRAMSGFSHILATKYGSTLDEQAKTYVNQISIASEKMGLLIEGILSLSRATRGKFKLEPLDISAMATRQLKELARGDSIRQVDWQVEPGLMATGDKVTVEAVMGNLLDNAWKYTGKTECATIRVHAGTQGPANEICVTDNGAGFDMAHAEQLFQPFRRLHRQDEFPGIGIGLATVQRIVHRHGGAIHAESTPNGGTTFCFTLSKNTPGATHEG